MAISNTMLSRKSVSALLLVLTLVLGGCFSSSSSSDSECSWDDSAWDECDWGE